MKSVLLLFLGLFISSYSFAYDSTKNDKTLICPVSVVYYCSWANQARNLYGLNLAVISANGTILKSEVIKKTSVWSNCLIFAKRANASVVTSNCSAGI